MANSTFDHGEEMVSLVDALLTHCMQPVQDEPPVIEFDRQAMDIYDAMLSAAPPLIMEFDT